MKIFLGPKCLLLLAFTSFGSAYATSSYARLMEGRRLIHNGTDVDPVISTSQVPLNDSGTSFSKFHTQSIHMTASAGNAYGGPTPYSPRGVFAHFMVSNVPSWTVNDWIKEIRIAKEAHIDAFALNMASNQKSEAQLPNAFSAARAVGFQLFFSFDYAGNGPWDARKVTDLILKYRNEVEYYKYQGKPFVSTFEGPERSGDWAEIKKVTNCFFMPDWSSLGADKALKASNGVADGLFSWAAWPWGDTDMDTYVDASYRFYLSQTRTTKPYMMPVSPWFFTNMPGFDKNWLWRGDNLWRDRWEQVMFVRPEFVQIISWNDYGESHYIGPIHKESMGAFNKDHGRASHNYALEYPHDGWRAILPFYIDTYKYGKATMTDQRLVTWYRPVESDACKDSTTTGNTASQLQLEFKPDEVMQDKIFFSALLANEHPVSVSIGGAKVTTSWRNKPAGGAGVYHGSADINKRQGIVQIDVAGMSVRGPPITKDCETGGNWNAWVGHKIGGNVKATTQKLSMDEMSCVEGTATGDFKELCSFTCKLGYCPISACFCTKMGPTPKPKPTNSKKAYPAAGMSSTYIGLCEFACSHGKCPPKYCGYTKHPYVEPTVSPFAPPACIEGKGEGEFDSLCKFGCKYGFCPIRSCTCTKKGHLLLYPDRVDMDIFGLSIDGTPDNGLCTFGCRRKNCPPSLCYAVSKSPSSINTLGCNIGFRDLTSVLKALDSGSLKPSCGVAAILEALANMIDLSEYEKARNTFLGMRKEYEDYYKDASVVNMNQFKKQDINKYFTCSGTFEGKDAGKVPCPPDRRVMQSGYELWAKIKDPKAFYSHMVEAYMIEKASIRFYDATYSETSDEVCRKAEQSRSGLDNDPNEDIGCEVAGHSSIDSSTLHGTPAFDRNAAVPDIVKLLDKQATNLKKLQAYLHREARQPGSNSALLAEGSYMSALYGPAMLTYSIEEKINVVLDARKEIAAQKKEKKTAMGLGIGFAGLGLISGAVGAFATTPALMGLAGIGLATSAVGDLIMTMKDTAKNPDLLPLLQLSVLMAPLDGAGFGAKISLKSIIQVIKTNVAISVKKLTSILTKNGKKIEEQVADFKKAEEKLKKLQQWEKSCDSRGL